MEGYRSYSTDPSGESSPYPPNFSPCYATNHRRRDECLQSPSQSRPNRCLLLILHWQKTSSGLYLDAAKVNTIGLYIALYLA